MHFGSDWVLTECRRLVLHSISWRGSLALIGWHGDRAAASLLLYLHRGFGPRGHYREEGRRDHGEQGHDGVAGGQLRSFLHILQHL